MRSPMECTRPAARYMGVINASRDGSIFLDRATGLILLSPSRPGREPGRVFMPRETTARGVTGFGAHWRMECLTEQRCPGWMY